MYKMFIFIGLLCILSFSGNCAPSRDGITIYEDCETSSLISSGCDLEAEDKVKMQNKKIEKNKNNKPLYSKRAETHCKQWNMSAEIKSINKRVAVGNTIVTKYHETYICR